MQVFLDTNIVLEGRPLADLPWGQLGASGPLLVYFVPKFLSEIDGKKRDGRLGEKARAFNRWISPLATSDAELLICDTPRVDPIDVVQIQRVDEAARYTYQRTLERKEIGPDDDATNLITAARKTIALEVKKLVERKEERDSEKEDTADWTQISAVSKKNDEPPVELSEAEARSIFDDVDQ